MFRSLLAAGTIAISVVTAVASAAVIDIGQIKVTHGSVSIERAGQSLPATPGARLREGDVVRTGKDGSVGITMSDNSLLSAGPNSEVALDLYRFDPTTNDGHFDTKLSRGTLSVVSGRIAKQSPAAMTVHTPGATLGVRGTEFVVSADAGRSAH